MYKKTFTSFIFPRFYENSIIFTFDKQRYLCLSYCFNIISIGLMLEYGLLNVISFLKHSVL